LFPVFQGADVGSQINGGCYENKSPQEFRPTLLWAQESFRVLNHSVGACLTSECKKYIVHPFLRWCFSRACLILTNS
jgi:hypothetical protein